MPLSTLDLFRMPMIRSVIINSNALFLIPVFRGHGTRQLGPIGFSGACHLVGLSSPVVMPVARKNGATRDAVHVPGLHWPGFGTEANEWCITVNVLTRFQKRPSLFPMYHVSFFRNERVCFASQGLNSESKCKHQQLHSNVFFCV